MHTALLVGSIVLVLIALIGGSAILMTMLEASLRIRRYRRSVFGIDDEILHEELTTHAHLGLVDPAPSIKPPHWWRRLG